MTWHTLVGERFKTTTFLKNPPIRFIRPDILWSHIQNPF